jgi:hypothetical protein
MYYFVTLPSAVEKREILEERDSGLPSTPQINRINNGNVPREVDDRRLASAIVAPAPPQNRGSNRAALFFSLNRPWAKTSVCEGVFGMGESCSVGCQRTARWRDCRQQSQRPNSEDLVPRTPPSLPLFPSRRRRPAHLRHHGSHPPPGNQASASRLLPLRPAQPR